MKNKKLVVSLLSTAMISSMAASAFAAPAGGLYVGGNVMKYYSNDGLIDKTADAIKDLNDADNNAVFVDDEGKLAASLDEILDKNGLNNALRTVEKKDFNGQYTDAVSGNKVDPGKDLEPVPGDLKVESVSAINNTSIKVAFNKAVEKLDKADVTVLNKKSSEKQYVKEVVLAEDKKSATVTFYDALTSKTTYNVAVKDAGNIDFDFVIGDVAKVVADTTQIVKAGNPTAIKFKVLDANDLDITSNVKPSDIEFESTAEVINGTVTLDNGVSAFVYIKVKKEDGTFVKSDRITIKGEAPKAKEVTNYTVNTDGKNHFKDEDYKQNLTITKEGTGYVVVEAKDQFDEVSTEKPSFESLDKTVALVDRVTGKITPIKEGLVPVKITYTSGLTKTIELKVVANAKAASIELDNAEISISNKVAAGKAVKVSVKDQYGNVLTSAKQATVKVVSGKDLVKAIGDTLTLKDGEGILTVSPADSAKSGTAVIEISVSDTVKTTLTVNVTAAGDIDNFVLEGFKAELDKNEADTNKNKEMTLSVFPVDANGVKTGDADSTAKFTIKDKDGKYLNANGSEIADGQDNLLPISTKIEAAKFKAGETYTVTVKVGSLVVFENAFSVKDTSELPVVNQKASSIVATDLDITKQLSDTFEITFGGKVRGDAKIVDFTFNSDNGAVVASAPDGTSEVKVVALGNTTLVFSEITVDLDSKEYTIELDSQVNVSAKLADLSASGNVTNAEVHTVDAEDGPVTGDYVDGVLTISHDFSKLTEEKGGAPYAAKWVGAYIEGPSGATSADLEVKGTNSKTFNNVSFESEAGYQDGFFYFFPAQEDGNTNDLKVAWFDEEGNIISVEKLQVKYVNETP
ncbi:Ig-like domain-containing protein [Brevibacillus sp. B_LB10_24]|uniref:Ig-like domain-containing protein n=1 Tax=Brevibacillus sp. B_LB10_24 TaxID=3380645 RepID=UPI0038BAFAC1